MGRSRIPKQLKNASPYKRRRPHDLHPISSHPTAQETAPEAGTGHSNSRDPGLGQRFGSYRATAEPPLLAPGGHHDVVALYLQDAERMHATAPVADVLGTVLIDKAVRALQKAAA